MVCMNAVMFLCVMLVVKRYNSILQLERHVEITDYNSLLTVASMQPQPQLFLFVFMKKSLPEDHKGDEAYRFNSGLGGELTPVMTLSKSVAELTGFGDLVQESKQQNREWDLVSVAALSGNQNKLPSDETALKQLELMMKTVESGGDLSKYMTFDKQGEPIVFSK